jgi:hypothetical protein
VNLIARRRDVSQNLAERPPFAAAAEPGAPMFELIELMFFAYRDFVGDADHLLGLAGRITGCCILSPGVRASQSPNCWTF